jgi:hypothetical protein
MSVVSRVFYWLSLFGLSVSLLYPCFERAMSWREATPAALGGLFFVSLWGLASVIFTPAKVKASGPFAVANHRRKTGILLGGVGVAFCLLVGGFVTYQCTEKLDAYESRRSSSGYGGGNYGSYGGGSYGGGYGYGGYRDSASSLEMAYNSQDRIGRELGYIVLATTILPLAGLLVFALRKPNPALMQASQGYAPQGHAPQGYAPQGYAPQGYAPQGYAPQGHAPQGHAPQGHAPQGHAPQGYAPQGHYAPQPGAQQPGTYGQPPQGYAPHEAPEPPRV